MENGVRRYFNLGPVVRDLEHALGPDATPEGRDYGERFVRIIVRILESVEDALAEEMDADDEPESDDDADALDGDDVGDEGLEGGDEVPHGAGGHAESSNTLRARIAGLERELAALTGPQSRVPRGAGTVDATGGDTSALRKVSNATKSKPAKRRAKSTPKKRR